MKKLAIYSLILSVVLLSGCIPWFGGAGMVIGNGHLKSETRAVAGVTGVTLATSGDLTVTTGAEDKLVIEAEDNLLHYLTSDVTSGVLELSTLPNTSINVTRPIHYTLTVKQLSKVNVLGSGDAQVDQLSGDTVVIRAAGSGGLNVGSVDGKELTLTVLGSGSVVITGGSVESARVESLGSGDLRAEGLNIGMAGSPMDQRINSLGSGRVTLGMLIGNTLNANLNGSGDVVLNGGALDNLVLEVLGSGSFRAQDTQVKDVQAKLVGSGSATLWVSGSINASLLGSGDLSYYGSATVNSSELGSGRVRGLGAK